MHYVSVFRVAAKPHRCWLCGDEIVKGSRYIYATSIQRGQYATWKHHVPCQALLDAEPDMYDGDEHYAWEGIHEYLFRSLSRQDALDALKGVPNEEDRAWLEAKYVDDLRCNVDKPRRRPMFRFADMFSGIGGFHLAMSALGGECVWAAERDTLARKTYLANFGATTPALQRDGGYAKDVEDVDMSDVPDHDMLCAGFPCQPFSIAGRRRGLDDVRGTMFFHIMRALQAKAPKMFFLENVPGLVKHDNGATFARMLELLRSAGYDVEWHLVCAADHGLPQARKRVYILGGRHEPRRPAILKPLPRPLGFTMSDVFGGKVDRDVGYTIRCGGRGGPIDGRHNWEAYRVDGVVQRLSVKQAARMMGLPPDFVFPISDTAAMRQLGNSVAVPAIADWGRALLEW